MYPVGRHPTHHFHCLPHQSTSPEAWELIHLCIPKSVFICTVRSPMNMPARPGSTTLNQCLNMPFAGLEITLSHPPPVISRTGPYGPNNTGASVCHSGAQRQTYPACGCHHWGARTGTPDIPITIKTSPQLLLTTTP